MSKNNSKSKIPYYFTCVLCIVFLLLGLDCLLGGKSLLGIRYMLLMVGMLCIALSKPSFLPIPLILHAIVTFLSQGLIKGNLFFNILDIVDLIGFILMILVPAFIYMVYLPRHDRYSVEQSPEDAKAVLKGQLDEGKISKEQYESGLKEIEKR